MSSSIPLHPRPHRTPHPLSPSATTTIRNPLPPVLQTPSGLALLELQGTINLPPFPPDAPPAHAIPIGRLHFPEYRADKDDDDTAWMKRVWMYVGEHQRLQGEVRKLRRAIAVLRRRGRGRKGAAEEGREEDGEEEELEVVEIVRYKIVFSSRPEPVGSGGAGLSG